MSSQGQQAQLTPCKMPGWLGTWGEAPHSQGHVPVKAHPGREVLPWGPGRGRQALAQWPLGLQPLRLAAPRKLTEAQRDFLISHAWSHSKVVRTHSSRQRICFFLEGLGRKELCKGERVRVPVGRGEGCR